MDSDKSSGVEYGELNPKQEINPFDLEYLRKLGNGDSSTVKLCRYKDALVAVKYYEKGETVKERKVRKKMFMREMGILSGLNHDNIVKFIGANESDMVIVEEYVEGRSLKKYLLDMRPNPLQVGTALDFALQISKAMEFLHNNNIIHRDLNPDNILLTEDEKTVMVVDFSLARKAANFMTPKIGTYGYMAPEVYKEKTPYYGKKVDVFSFSLILWELITNQAPFPDKDAIDNGLRVMQGERPPISGIVDVPNGLVPLLEKCWAADPLDRPEFKDISMLLSVFLAVCM